MEILFFCLPLVSSHMEIGAKEGKKAIIGLVQFGPKDLTKLFRYNLEKKGFLNMILGQDIMVKVFDLYICQNKSLGKA